MNPPSLPTRIARQLPDGVERHADTVGGHALHWLTAGAGRPVLMVHGNPTWSFLWRQVIARLRGLDVQAVAPDLVGLGLSARVPSRWHTLEHHQAVLAAFVEALDLRDVVLVVQDWGGAIGVGAFLDQPERLSGLVVLNTVLGPPREGFRPTSFHRFAHTPILADVAFRALGYPQRALHQAQGDPSTLRGDVAYAYRWPLRGLSRNAAPLALARMVPDGPDHPSIPALRRVADLVAAFDGPSAIVWGDRDPVLGRAFRRVSAALPEARVWRTQAGHFLQEEVPDEIALAIQHVAQA